MSAPVAGIPFTVIGGFLGSGKTTLLNRLLRSEQPMRLAALVNDFGAINIDSAAIAAVHGDTIALTNGCVCCSIGDDLSQALIKVIDATPSFDGILVEASGVSDPWRIAQLGMAAPELRLDSVIVVVDAFAVLSQAEDRLLADALRTQLRHADLLILNKAELVSEQALGDVKAWLYKETQGRPCIPASFCDVPQGVLTGAALKTSARVLSDGVHESHLSQYETWAHKPEGTFPLSAWREWLDRMPPGVLRLKGWILSSDHGWHELQVAGMRSSWQPVDAAPDAQSSVVAIGLNGRLPLPWLVQMPGLSRQPSGLTAWM